VALPYRPQQVRLGAVIAVAIAAGLGVWLGTRGSDHPARIVPLGGATGKQVVPITATGLETLASVLARPIYWAGQMPGATYELTRLADGQVFLRYLPAGAKAGANIEALTVGTYPVKDAFAATQRIAARPDSVGVPVTGGAIAFYARSAPSSVYLAFPGSNVQIEVYDPLPAQARKLVTTGQIVTVG